MARRTTKAPSRLELRKAAEAAEGAEGTTVAKKKAASDKPKRKSTKKKAAVPRYRLVWGVFDNSNQQIATFAYNERAGADRKASDMTEKGRGKYFVQPVKEVMPPEEVAEE